MVCVSLPATIPAKPMRLDIVLHGSTRTTGIAELKFIQAYDGGDHEEPPPPDVDYIELFPMGRLGENAYRFEGETDVDEGVTGVPPVLFWSVM